MTFFSIAIVLIFVLYLIDKRNAWRGALKVLLAIVTLAVLTAAGIYGWDKYQDRSAQKRHEAEVTACVKTLTEGSIVFVRTGDEVNNVIKSFCESHPGTNISCGIKADSDGNLATYALGDTDKGTPGKVCTAKGWSQDPMANTSNELSGK
jgi:uncharacterized membrane protein YsdA (DUF1294 family)